MPNLAALFFLIADMLLWPVMAALTLALAASLVLVGTTLARAIRRLSEGKERRALRARFLANDPAGAAELLGLKGDEQVDAAALRTDSYLGTIRTFMLTNSDSAAVESALANFVEAAARRATLPRVLTKLGPALGLMGTLIPLGPALVGLATGDLETLAVNLRIAFSTTVVGLAASSIAYVAAACQKRADAREALDATFIAGRICEWNDASRDRDCAILEEYLSADELEGDDDAATAANA